MSNSNTSTIPKWITVISGFISLLGLFVGCSLYISPATFIPNIDFSSADIKYLTNMWAARQIAIAGIIGYSLFRQSVSMLKISLIAYSIMNVQDIFIGVSKSDNGLIIGATVACVLASTIVFILSKRKKREYQNESEPN